MKVRIIDADESLKRLQLEAADILLGNNAGEKECIVEAVKGVGEGFSIERSNSGAIRIIYGSIPSLCKALSHIVGKNGNYFGGEESSVRRVNCFNRFGIMADCSRNGVLRVDTVKKLIKYAAFMGYSFVGLYTEDTLEVENEPYFGYMRGRYTKEEIKELVSYGEIFGVELRPFIQTLAHLNQIVRYQDYSGIVDANDILLIDDERTYELIENIIRSVSQSFKTKKINIGMDEAMMVGLGKYKDIHGICDRHEIMCRHLSRVLAICEKYGLEAEMWSDMFFRIAAGGEYHTAGDIDLTKVTVPKNVTLSYWDYYSIEQEHYSNMLKQHKRLTDKTSFAGGAWKWEGFAPFNEFSIETGKMAIDACRENDVKECTITCWGDDGAECSIFAILPALFADSAFAYGEEPDEDAFRALTGIGFDEFMLIDQINPGVGADLTRNNMSKNLLYNDPLIGTFDNLVREDTAKYFEDMAAKLEGTMENKEFGYIFETLGSLCRVLALKADLGVRLKKAYDENDLRELSRISLDTVHELLLRLEDFYEVFRKQWMKENKSFGFEVQSIRLGGLERRLMDTVQIVNSYVQGEIKKIEELSEKRLPFASEYSPDLEHTLYNRWFESASPSRFEF